MVSVALLWWENQEATRQKNHQELTKIDEREGGQFNDGTSIVK